MGRLTPQVPLMTKPNDKSCPSCRSNNLEDGKFGTTKHTFVPKGRFMMVGYVANGNLCLDCGFLAHYIDESDLVKIRSDA